MFSNLPKEIQEHIVSFVGGYKKRNGRWMKQFEPNDPRKSALSTRPPCYNTYYPGACEYHLYEYFIYFPTIISYPKVYFWHTQNRLRIRYNAEISKISYTYQKYKVFQSLSLMDEGEPPEETHFLHP